MFNFKKVDPTPLRKRGSLDTDSASQQLMALDIVNKYVFTDEHGSVFHECELPADADIYNCGGYADKVAKYRDPQLYDYLKREGVSEKSLESDGFPILATQSPKLDLILFEMIKLQRRQNGHVRVSLFDLGCTVAEHYDLLDVFFQTEDDSAARIQELERRLAEKAEEVQRLESAQGSVASPEEERRLDEDNAARVLDEVFLRYDDAAKDGVEAYKAMFCIARMAYMSSQKAPVSEPASEPP